MNIYAIPVFGWFIGAILHVSLAVPFYFIWNALAPTYFYFVPPVYQQIGFWECVGLFVVISILKAVLVPNLTSSTSSSSGSK